MMADRRHLLVLGESAYAKFDTSTSPMTLTSFTLNATRYGVGQAVYVPALKSYVAQPRGSSLQVRDDCFARREFGSVARVVDNYPTMFGELLFQ